MSASQDFATKKFATGLSRLVIGSCTRGNSDPPKAVKTAQLVPAIHQHSRQHPLPRHFIHRMQLTQVLYARGLQITFCGRCRLVVY
jgi:hypothetical protein